MCFRFFPNENLKFNQVIFIYQEEIIQILFTKNNDHLDEYTVNSLYLGIPGEIRNREHIEIKKKYFVRSWTD